MRPHDFHLNEQEDAKLLLNDRTLCAIPNRPGVEYHWFTCVGCQATIVAKSKADADADFAKNWKGFEDCDIQVVANVMDE